MLMETLRNLPAVLLAGLLFGAGLPVLFAFAMAAGSGKTEEVDGKMMEVKPPALPMRILSYLLFALVIVLIVVGVLWVSQWPWSSVRNQPGRCQATWWGLLR